MQVHDILSVPDYTSYFEPHMHTFGRFAKGEWTQHQFFFNMTDDSRFPNGVKISYRKYAAEKACEIVLDPHHPTG